MRVSIAALGFFFALEIDAEIAFTIGVERTHRFAADFAVRVARRTATHDRRKLQRAASRN